MDVLYRCRATEVGSEVPDLLEGGLLILFGAGVPAELAEISVLHHAEPVQTAHEPRIGDIVSFGNHEVYITALGDRAWVKARDLGHITFSFNGAMVAERPGEICVTALAGADLLAALGPGTVIELRRASV